jgi:hypothetical protein|tara:strand:- start:572 stop:808 length:237 start_codon:yes stop_codon:yes gene_type:complete
MIWHWLTLYKFFNKIGNYFYSLHVTTLHSKQRKERQMSLYKNINAKKKSGTSNPKSKSTVSAKSYSAMKKGFPKKKGK